MATAVGAICGEALQDVSAYTFKAERCCGFEYCPAPSVLFDRRQSSPGRGSDIRLAADVDGAHRPCLSATSKQRSAIFACFTFDHF
jgi:hypothetical protein